jgi:hypothetical protein
LGCDGTVEPRNAAEATLVIGVHDGLPIGRHVGLLGIDHCSASLSESIATIEGARFPCQGNRMKG